MLVRKISGLIVVASAITVAACNDNNSPRSMTPVIVTPTPPPGVPAPSPMPEPATTTAGQFATDQVTTLTCVDGKSVEINAVTFADSETPVDVTALNAGCMGGPAS